MLISLSMKRKAACVVVGILIAVLAAAYYGRAAPLERATQDWVPGARRCGRASGIHEGHRYGWTRNPDRPFASAGPEPLDPKTPHPLLDEADEAVWPAVARTCTRQWGRS